MYRIWFFLLLLPGAVLRAEEATVTLHSTVSGNQEQPRVMYIVPWQQPGDPELDYELQGSIAEELFVPIDRDEFVRGLAYRALLEEQVGAAHARERQQEYANN